MPDGRSKPTRKVRPPKPTDPVCFWLGIAAICVAMVVVWVLIEATFTPWARSLAGGPTLTGEWLGQMTTPTGTKHLVWIEIDHSLPSDSCYGCPNIEGRVATCDAAKIHHYEMWGSVENWSGTVFHLKTREAEESEVHLLYLDGKWGGDEIRLTTTLVAPGIPQTTRWERSEAGVETTTVIDGHPDTRAPINFSLARGTFGDFGARCKAGAS